MATIIIQRLDGTVYDLDAMGFRVKKFDIPLPNYNHSYQQIGYYGSTLIGTQAQQLVIPLVIDITAMDIHDYNFQLLQLRRVFRSDEDFFVINMYAPFIRWRCRAEAVTPSQNGNFWRASDVTINLDCPSGFAESVATTQDPVDPPNNGWGFGQGFNTDQLPSYTYTTPDFTFFNAGVIPLRADDRPVKITFQGTAPNGFTLTNNTTKQSFKLTKGVRSSDVVTILGFVPSINGKQEYSSSDHGFLDFAVGENRLHLDGASGFTMKFDTRFYY